MEDVIIQQLTTTDDVTTDGLTTERVTTEVVATELLVADGAAADTARTSSAPRLARSDRAGTLLAGIGIGAGLMYFLDADRGARRRQVLADQIGAAFRSVRRDARDRLVDVRNRAQGLVAETRGRMGDEQVDGEQLVARVRSELGHHVEHARAIEVVADGGTVTLRGQVPAEEQAGLVAAVGKVRGVESVNDQLEVRQRPGGEPPLQR